MYWWLYIRIKYEFPTKDNAFSNFLLDKFYNCRRIDGEVLNSVLLCYCRKIYQFVNVDYLLNSKITVF
jgi:hypothetical protein